MNLLPLPNWFVGLPVSFEPEWLAWLADLSGQSIPGLRFFKPIDLHITLAFFGAIKSEQVGAVLNCLKETGEPMKARLDQLLFLPSQIKCSAIAFSFLQGRERLVRMMEELQEPLCKAAGVSVDRRAHLPHVSIARPRRWSVSKHKSYESLIEVNQPEDRIVSIGAPVLYTRSSNRNHSLFRIVKAVQDS